MVIPPFILAHRARNEVIIVILSFPRPDNNHDPPWVTASSLLFDLPNSIDLHFYFGAATFTHVTDIYYSMQALHHVHLAGAEYLRITAKFSLS